MKTHHLYRLLALALALACALAGCSLDVGDLNNASTDELESDPSIAAVTAAATGLLIGHRERIADQNGYIALTGVLGREAYNLNVETDARFVSEMLKGAALDPGSPRFGGNFWADRYANIRNANVLLDALDALKDGLMTEPDKAALRGYARTIQALDYLLLVSTRDGEGIVLDVARPFGAPLAPIRCRDAALAFIGDLLDSADAELAMAGEAFPVPLSSGFAGFDTPATFRAFNRAIRARAAVYAGDGETALEALEGSFLVVDEADPRLDLGVYHVFGTSAGDTRNGLTDPNIYAHPSVVETAIEGDARLARKVRAVSGEADDPTKTIAEEGIEARHKFTLYPSATTPVPIIRNEELVLLRAEAHLLTGDLEAAAEDLNYIRRVSGGLTDRDDLTAEGAIVDELLYNRFLSLLFEGGHRWIDMRRYDRLDALPRDAEDHAVHAYFPIPTAERDARGIPAGEAIVCEP